MLAKPGLRRFFWFMVIFAVFGNILIDVFLSNESSEAAEAGQWVRRSYTIIQELDRTSADIAQLRTIVRSDSKDFKDTLNDLFERLNQLEALTVAASDEGRHVARLRQLMTQPFSPQVSDQARVVLRMLRTGEDQILLRRLKYDETQTSLAHQEMQWGSVFDTALVVLLVLIYWFDIKSKQKTEALLTDTIRVTEAANQQLEALSQSRFDLLRTTAHDLKNPLGSIMGFVDIIHNERSDQDTVRALTERIQRISNETLELVSRLVEPGGSRFEPVDLRRVLQQVHAQNEALAWRKQQKLDLSLSESQALIVQGDKVKVREIFQNLISNAIKFSPLQSRIFIRAGLAGGDGQKVRIEIQDQGPGFSQTDKQLAFKRGHHLSAKPTAGESSTGLGLSIVKEFIDTHHASISIADAPGGGALFQIDWPLSKNFAAISN